MAVAISNRRRLVITKVTLCFTSFEDLLYIEGNIKSKAPEWMAENNKLLMFHAAPLLRLPQISSGTLNAAQKSLIMQIITMISLLDLVRAIPSRINWGIFLCFQLAAYYFLLPRLTLVIIAEKIQAVLRNVAGNLNNRHFIFPVNLLQWEEEVRGKVCK